MIRRELVIRERDAEDARARALRLTSKGEELTDRVIPLAQLYERITLAGIGEDQEKILKECLDRIYNNMDMLDKRDRA
jgi:DNA-binding MarR family transcriptional regulator